MENAGLTELIQNATSLMLTDVHPELLGRAYLTQEQYPEAAEVFRQWALRTPSDWKPYYYMSLAYDYQGKEPEASSLARWSQNIANHETSIAPEKPAKTSATNSEIAAELAAITQTVWETRDVASAQKLSEAEKRKQMEKLHDAEQKLGRICTSKHASLTCQIQQARILDREATIEASPEVALKKQGQAIALVAAIIQKMPDNGGLYEQHAVLLQDLVAIEKRGGTKQEAIAEKETEEVAEFTRALELRPTQVSPLWGVLYALIDLKRNEDAVHLTRTITLLQPESTAANAAYVVALEHAMKKAGREAEREADVAAHLNPLLQSASNSELQALWHSCQDQHDSENMVKLAVAWKRRFPNDRAFKDPVFKENMRTALAKASDGDGRTVTLRDKKDLLKRGKENGR
jgi:tetratricopeptide (TPR) repeat protein